MTGGLRQRCGASQGEIDVVSIQALSPAQLAAWFLVMEENGKATVGLFWCREFSSSLFTMHLPKDLLSLPPGASFVFGDIINSS